MVKMFKVRMCGAGDYRRTGLVTPHRELVYGGSASRVRSHVRARIPVGSPVLFLLGLPLIPHILLA